MRNQFLILINKLEYEFKNDKINVIKSYLNNQLFDKNKTNELNNLKEKLNEIKQNKNQMKKKLIELKNDYDNLFKENVDLKSELKKLKQDHEQNHPTSKHNIIINLNVQKDQVFLVICLDLIAIYKFIFFSF